MYIEKFERMLWFGNLWYSGSGGYGEDLGDLGEVQWQDCEDYCQYVGLWLRGEDDA